MGKKLVLFGAGMYAKTYKALLDYLKINFDYYTDNDQNKFNIFLYNKKIISPQTLIELDCNIILSCTYDIEIEKQLEEMDVIHKLNDVGPLYEQFNTQIALNSTNVARPNRKKRSIIIDMYEGIGWGGSEMWAISAAEGLKEINHSIKLFGSDQQVMLDDDMEGYVKRFSVNNTIKDMAEEIEANLPCTVINNFAGCVLLAALLVKQKYPNDVRIISVIHNDNPGVFNAHMRYIEEMETVFCVSREIKEKIIGMYSIEESRVCFKEPYIEYEPDYHKNYTIDSEPIKIGYAGRLVKQAKRADILPQIINLLEANNINYQLEIAGDGECKKKVDEYVASQNLQDKVKLLGRIPKEKMSSFWKRQDIFINFSEHEGTSLAMLESMSYGCVPIVTIVSGVKEYIQENYNGFMCQVGDLETLVRMIKQVEQNRTMLTQYGLKCRKIIEKRCNKKDYISFLDKLL